MNRKVGLTLAALGTLAIEVASPPASADIMVATYTGIVSGYDYAGIFGNIGGLTGDSFVAEFTYDTSLGIIFDLPQGQHLGGIADGASSDSMLKATLTINGVTQLFSSGYDGYVWIEDGYVQHGVLTYVNDHLSDYLYLVGYPGFPTDSLDQRFLSTPMAGYGYALLYSNGSDLVEAYLTTSTLGIAAVPELPTWAISLLGFAGLGFAACRRATAQLSQPNSRLFCGGSATGRRFHP